MAGYSGQLVALDADQFDLNTPLTNAAKLRDDQQNYDFNQQANPLRVQQMQEQNDASQISIDNARTAQPQVKHQANLQDLAYQDTLISRAAALIDPNDPDAAKKWDEAMKEAAAQGATQATQYIGRYTPALHDRVTGAYSAQSPLQAASAMAQDSPFIAGASMGGAGGGAGGGAAAAGQGPPGGGNYDQMFQNKSPAELNQIRQSAQSVQDALARVANSQDPAATWDEEARQMGHPDWVGHYSPMRAAQLYQATKPINDYLTTRLAQFGIGVPAPVQQEQAENANGVVYGVRHDAKGNIITRPLTPQGRGQLVGTDPSTGQGIYYDPVTGAETEGQHKLAAKPGTHGGAAAGGSVYEDKRQAWLEVHPGDTAGALDYAAGHKTMTTGDARKAADAQAARDLADISASGGVIANPQAWLKQQSDAHFADYSAAAPAAPGAGGGAARPVLAPGTQYKGYQVMDATSAAAAARIPGNKGKWFYGTDGVARQFH